MEALVGCPIAIVGTGSDRDANIVLRDPWADRGKSLHRMLSASGNPSMDNLAAIFDVLRRNLQVDIEVRAA